MPAPNPIFSQVSDEVRVMVRNLASLAPIEYDRVRHQISKQNGMTVIFLDKLVDAQKRENGFLRLEQENEVEPWATPICGRELLEELVETISRYLVLPEGCAEALALWVMHTWLHDACDISPILAIRSPDKRCGKTTLITLLQALVRRPFPTSNITMAALFRSIPLHQPTILIDEADTFLKGKEDLRGLLNSGHNRASAFITRCEGEANEPRRFETWCPKAIAQIGPMAPTLRDRSIEIRMRRKLSNEKVERLKACDMKRFLPLKRKCARWAKDNFQLVKNTDPQIPFDGIDDRAADNWRTLLAIAQVADWLDCASEALRRLTERFGEASGVGQQLLEDIEKLFSKRNQDKLSSQSIVDSLKSLVDRLWPDYRNGRPLTQSDLARLLAEYDIRPKTIRIGSSTLRGYERRQFEDAFARYVSSATAKQ